MGFPEAQYAIDEVVDELKPTLTSVANVMMSRISIRCLVPGTAFKIEQTDGNDFTTTTKIIAKTDYKDANGVYWVHVPVPPGEYKITITKEDITTTATVSAKVAGQSYTFTYEVYKLVQTFTSNGEFNINDATNTWPGVYVTALGGGGGGGAGGCGYSYNSVRGGNGGGGGGRSNAVILRYVTATAFQVTIGAGGTGGAKTTTDGAINPGTSGGSTVLAGVLTVPGGGGGGGATYADYNKPGTRGTGGNVGGGAGGQGIGKDDSGDPIYYNAFSGSAGSALTGYGISGAGGAAGGFYSVGGSGGGGAGGYGVGGNGGNAGYAKNNATNGGNGGIGAGGGGGGGGNARYDSFANNPGGAGGNGGNGIVLIYKGLVMK